MSRYRQGDSIAAIATPPGVGGVGILRISGPDALGIAQEITRSRTLRPRHAHFRRFHEADGALIDHGICLYFPAPASYTGEDVAELQGHGSPAALAALLARAIALGARAARAGEFSERAFLNGRLDLAQAEAVADLIHARSATQARAAAASLEGAFSTAVTGIHDALLTLRAWIEAGLDFSEEELGAEYEETIARQLSALAAALDDLLATTRHGARLAMGGRVVLAGRPNVGKSSLLNALAQRDTAIVTAIPGTTRDLLREEILIDGLPVELIDTAGLRQAGDAVEAEGIARARKILESAQCILLVADAASGWQAEDSEILAGLPARPRLVLWNKADLVPRPPSGPEGEKSLAVSARNGAGLEELRTAMAGALGWSDSAATPFSARRRHVEALERCRCHLQQALGLHQQQAPAELVAEALRLAGSHLAEITGQVGVEDLLGKIFCSFCVGK